MKIPELYSVLLIVFFIIVSDIEAKKKNNPSSSKSHKKKASKEPEKPQDPIPHGIYTQNGKCFCPINSGDSSSSVASEEGDGSGEE